MKKKKFTIVVADDDLDDQHIIQQAIRATKIDHDLKIVGNGLELIDLLYSKGKYQERENLKPDLIIMDLNMPLLDGYGVLKQVKASENLKSIPVYVLSTSRFEYDQKKSIELGAHDFFSKPYQFEDLKLIIMEICTKTVRALDKMHP